MITTPDEAAVLAALHTLRATPPPGFTEGVLARVGLPADVDDFVMAAGPAGPIFVAFNAAGICHVLAAHVVDGDPERYAAVHRERFGRPARAATTKAPAGLEAALRTGRTRKLTFDLRGRSEFEQAVLRKALDIPRGELRPYGWVAREIGRPNAVRAVGSALGHNPVPVLIPCHRVVRADGAIGDYVFGSEMKRTLLDTEDLDVAETERLARSGVRYVGSDTTNIFCFPTCRHARRITGPHRVPFRRPEEAAGAGYRPCADCRPSEASAA